MVSLVNQIESYLNRLLSLSEDNAIEIKRADLAEIFMCVPSQINYVLETRFRPEAGYYVESKRGGGGYVRIVKLNFDADADLALLLNEAGARSVSRTAGESLLQRLYAEELLTKREAVLFRAMMQEGMFGLPSEEAGLMRGRVIRLLLSTLLRDDLD